MQTVPRRPAAMSLTSPLPLSGLLGLPPLYETAARSAEVLRLDVGDLDLPNRKAKVTRKGGAIDVIVWQTGRPGCCPGC